MAIVGTLDTKGEELAFLRQCITDAGAESIVIDLGIIGEPGFKPDFSADNVAASVGSTLAELRSGQDKARAIQTMASGAAVITRRLYDDGKIDGVISLGGGQGTLMATAAMRALPVGVPKLMVSTLLGVASGGISRLVGTRDMTVMNSVVDISGLNSFARTIIANAAAAVVGMVSRRAVAGGGGEAMRVCATMFGVTTPCVTSVREKLAAYDVETVVFAATGSGDRAMEDLIRDGLIDGVIDVTPSQVGQDLIRGYDRAGPERLEVAGRLGLPQVVALGGLDIVIVGPNDSALEDEVSRGLRKSFRHSPLLTVVRPTVDESRQAGELIARKLNGARGPVTVVIPTLGWSDYSGENGPLHDPDADAALIGALEQDLDNSVPVVKVISHINAKEFADELVAQFVALTDLRVKGGNQSHATDTNA